MESHLLKALTVVLGILLPIVSADPAASTLYLDKAQTIFSINVANDSNDTYFYFESAYRHAWFGIGTGTGMKNSLMFFLYPTKNGSKVTLSPRISSGSNEPTFSKNIQVEVLSDTNTDGKMAVGAVCHNFRSWNGGSLDVLSTVQPWMYAFGPSGNPVTSDSPTAGLTQHTIYGKFTMDMVQVTGAGQLPNPTTQMSGVTLVGDRYKHDGDIVAPIHGWLMAALVIIFTPLLILHLLSAARFVWIQCTIFFLVLLVGLVCGFWVSTYYNRSKNWDSPHQIIGYITIAFLLILIPFRILSHHSSRSENQRRRLTIAGKALGHLTWILALVNGVLGIRLADSKARIYIAYGCCIAAMFLVTIPLMIMIKRRQRRREHVKITNPVGVIPVE